MLVGKNLAVLRGDMPQAALAAKMRELGWKWSQATVWAVEKGDRPLRVAEAQDVLALLGYRGIDFTLLRATPLADLRVAVRRAQEAWETVVRAIVEFRDEQMQLSSAYSRAREEGLELTKGDLGSVDSWLGRGVLPGAIEEADRRWWKEGAEATQPPPDMHFNGVDTPMWVDVSASDGIDQEAP